MSRSEASERGGNDGAAGTRHRRVLRRGTGHQVHLSDVGDDLRGAAVLRERTAEADADGGGSEEVRADTEGRKEASGTDEDVRGVRHPEHGASAA